MSVTGELLTRFLCSSVTKHFRDSCQEPDLHAKHSIQVRQCHICFVMEMVNTHSCVRAAGPDQRS